MAVVGPELIELQEKYLTVRWRKGALEGSLFLPWAQQREKMLPPLQRFLAQEHLGFRLGRRSPDTFGEQAGVVL